MSHSFYVGEAIKVGGLCPYLRMFSIRSVEFLGAQAFKSYFPSYRMSNGVSNVCDEE